jgi:transposase
MNKKLFSKSQMKELEMNPNVTRVTKQAITYNPEFKVKVVRENLKGKSPAQIFVEHGFDLDIIGKDLPRKRLYQWKKIYTESGELGLSEETRGKAKANESSLKVLSVEDKLKKQKQELNS